ncbi:hypothetical protein [Sulfuracidifex metallicus]|uniref:Uncharacterized protein n=1 Tax=Sulfuracidifex metallicus DSM 6482 = JCM 9184 TaxID=523847 RepID=A0A6A9QQF4_SULME|nr:hypothetical protein [Sulfuracidifex metallicus]MUN29525.1 hypothetical protein [Sulfuracidifex metallicus DSM 6482 = JCM 9184]WOE49964.1 hypothetical protein RQ359_001457 [Sulfuracidifex metallicus DSM 6482 = JCM 9184]
MADLGVSEFILVIVAVILGLVIFSFASSYFIPAYSFTNAQQYAISMSNDVFVTLSPPGVSDTGQSSFLGYIYSPGYSGNFTVVPFCVPTSELPAIEILSPQDGASPTFRITLNPSSTGAGQNAKEVAISSVYDINGHLIVNNIKGYEVPGNEPFELEGKIGSNQALILWVIYYSGGYDFRLTYTYSTG